MSEGEMTQSDNMEVSIISIKSMKESESALNIVHLLGKKKIIR